VLIGTTDIRIDDPDQAMCEADEFDYLRAAVREVFPGITIERHQVVARFCGVRPLPRSTTGFTGQISRDHACHETPPAASHPFPVFSLVGGKWTTFRAFSEPMAETARLAWIARTAQRTGVENFVVAALFDRYGTTAAAFARHLAAAGPESLATIGPYFAGELDFIVRHEAVVHLDDLLLRRTVLGLWGHLDPERLNRVVAIVTSALGWTEQQGRTERERTIDLLRTRHGVRWPEEG
jgi:glycerol-3-phosphate dehydrogenase